jgi:hypothetical protein
LYTKDNDYEDNVNQLADSTDKTSDFELLNISIRLSNLQEMVDELFQFRDVLSILGDLDRNNLANLRKYLTGNDDAFEDEHNRIISGGIR